MSKGYVTTGQEHDFPIPSSMVWLVAIYPDGSYEPLYLHPGRLHGTLDILETKPPMLLFCVWNGQWNTNLLKCDPRVIASRIRKEIE